MSGLMSSQVIQRMLGLAASWRTAPARSRAESRSRMDQPSWERRFNTRRRRRVALLHDPRRLDVVEFLELGVQVGIALGLDLHLVGSVALRGAFAVPVVELVDDLHPF